MLGVHHEARNLVECAAFAQTDVPSTLSALFGHQRQFKGVRVALLGCDKVGDGFDLGGIDKGALHTGEFAIGQHEHISTSNQVVGPFGIEDDAAFA